MGAVHTSHVLFCGASDAGTTNLAACDSHPPVHACCAQLCSPFFLLCSRCTGDRDARAHRRGDAGSSTGTAKLHTQSDDGLKLRPNRDTYTAMMVSAAKLSDATLAMDVYEQARAANHTPERIGFTAVLRALATDTSGYSDSAAALKKLAALMAKKKIRLDST